MTQRLAAAGLLLLVAACLLSCGGGGGGGGAGGTPTNPGPQTPVAGITFTQNGPAPSNSLSLRAGSSSSANSLVLDVVATDVVDLYGVAFDLVFPANALSFQSASEGTFLTGSQTSIQTSVNGTILIVGYSKLGAVGGASGSGVVMTLRFSAASSGGGSIVFDNQRAIDPTGREFTTLTWISGDVSVTT